MSHTYTVWRGGGGGGGHGGGGGGVWVFRGIKMFQASR